MDFLQSLHRTAMEFNLFAGVAMAKGFEHQSNEAYKVAFDLEKKVAIMARLDDKGPLPHYVLMRSAAALAYKAGLYGESEKLIEICLSDNPPLWLEEELFEIKDLIEKEDPSNGLAESQILQGVFSGVNTLENEIGLQDVEGNVTVRIIVPTNILSDIVKKHWSKKVTVEARQTPHGVMVLEKISAAA